ncbi:uncharacterized protein LOC141610746 [Silene latifolia]|uniref:uncharacterized protein LOC141610746 n=1 Tax=Silene latifolia TaxID=37657 RepID=UPI003D773493
MDANIHATAAINQFNNLTQKGKLKLETVINSACYALDRDNFFYIMFYAMDMESNTQSIYQVGMAELGGQPLLGLLRDYLNEKILAVISLKGTNYNSTVKKKKYVSSLTTGSSTLER